MSTTAGRTVRMTRDAMGGVVARTRAVRSLGIPRGQQPESITRVELTDKIGRRVLGDDGLPIQTREYTFVRQDGSRVVIQDHAAGHRLGEGGTGDQGPHVNVRPIEDTRHGVVPGTQAHYPFVR